VNGAQCVLTAEVEQAQNNPTQQLAVNMLNAISGAGGSKRFCNANVADHGGASSIPGEPGTEPHLPGVPELGQGGGRGPIRSSRGFLKSLGYRRRLHSPYYGNWTAEETIAAIVQTKNAEQAVQRRKEAEGEKSGKKEDASEEWSSSSLHLFPDDTFEGNGS